MTTVQKNTARRLRKGFTLLEILIAVAIVFHSILWARNRAFLWSRRRTILAVIAIAEIWQLVTDPIGAIWGAMGFTNATREVNGRPSIADWIVGSLFGAIIGCAKDDIKKDLNRSPDKGDSIVYAFASDFMAQETTKVKAAVGKRTSGLYNKAKDF